MKRTSLLKIPISVKLISLFLLLLVSSTAVFVYQTSQQMEKELLGRENYTNLSEVIAKSFEVEQTLLALQDKTRTFGGLYYASLLSSPIASLTPSPGFTSATAPTALPVPGDAKEPVPSSTLPQKTEIAKVAEITTATSMTENATTTMAPSAKPSDLVSKNKKPESKEVERFRAQFEAEKSFVNIEVWTQKDGQLSLMARYTKQSFLDENKMTPADFEALRTKQSFPMPSLLQKKSEIRNASVTNGAAIGTFGIPLVHDADEQVTHLLLVDFPLAILQKSFATESERTQYLVDKTGTMLAHPDDKLVLAQADYSKEGLVEKAIADSQPRRLLTFINPKNNEETVGAYVKLAGSGVIILSEVPTEVILAPAKQMRAEAFKTAGIILSVAIILIFLFSMTLTGPIEVLAVLVRHVSKGNFDIKAGDRLKSLIEDEVHDLAHAFDAMTVGLKERDKVKSLFSKFHGSSVADDLINNDIGVGGQNKEVTVFFSDIRGFTAFSENKTPEEVVTMLNEYFEVMVGIITRHGGVVDKFIGDAIMAVWGAPKATEKDTHNAVRACLDMRLALDQLNKKRISENNVPIKIGMGLHTGRAISGTIGSTERMEYTVIGDTVNMSSRIEASTKAFGTDLLVSQSVIDKVQEAFLFELAGEAAVKGKTEPLRMFNVRGYKDETTGGFVEIATEYSRFEPEDDAKVKVSA